MFLQARKVPSNTFLTACVQLLKKTNLLSFNLMTFPFICKFVSYFMLLVFPTDKKMNLKLLAL